MSLIKDNVINDFEQWARNNMNRNIFPTISDEVTSYYINRESEETYIMEYTFKTMLELKELLEKYSGLSMEPEMLKKTTVEVCQNRFQCDIYNNEKSVQKNSRVKFQPDEKEQEAHDKKTLPEFIYVF